MPGMSIENMTRVSHLLFALSGVFGVAAAALFFLFDITRCWRMTLKKRVSDRKQQNPCREAAVNNIQTEKLDCLETKLPETVFLYSDREILPNYNFSEKRIN